MNIAAAVVSAYFTCTRNATCHDGKDEDMRVMRVPLVVINTVLDGDDDTDHEKEDEKLLMVCLA